MYRPDYLQNDICLLHYRCGALHIGDLVLSIDDATVEHMSIAEATQLMRNSVEETMKLEVLPHRIVEQQNSREHFTKHGGHKGTVKPHDRLLGPQIWIIHLSGHMFGNPIINKYRKNGSLIWIFTYIWTVSLGV